MATTAKSEIKAPLEAWLRSLDDCFDPDTGRLVHPPEAELTCSLHTLFEADVRPITTRGAALEYHQMLESQGMPVPLERKEMPATFHWTIIKKWDRWKKLRVVETISRLVDGIEPFWHEFLRLYGAEASPYTALWIRYHNDQYAAHFIRGENASYPDIEQVRQYGALAAVYRICKAGGSATVNDIEVLEPFAERSKSSLTKTNYELRKHLSSLGHRADAVKLNIDAVCVGTGALYATALAYEIESRHQHALPAVNAWNREWAVPVSGFLRAVGNSDYIDQLRGVLPIPRAGDPKLEQVWRMKAKRAMRRVTPRAQLQAQQSEELTLRVRREIAASLRLAEEQYPDQP